MSLLNTHKTQECIDYKGKPWESIAFIQGTNTNMYFKKSSCEVIAAVKLSTRINKSFTMCDGQTASNFGDR